MRLDRFITLNLIQPFHLALAWIDRPASPASDLHLPVLMYHSISDDPEPGVQPYYRVCTSSHRFREQMRWLKENGYQGVTLSEGIEWLNSKTRAADPPSSIPYASRAPRPVAITFDDGFRDFYTKAFPALRESQFAATMYLPTAFIGEVRRAFHPAGHLRAKRELECLTWAEVKELHRNGVEFGSHTVSHPKLADLSWKEVDLEIRNSKSEIEERLGCAVKSFAHPYAFPQARKDFVTRFCDLLGTVGYENNVTTEIGRVWKGDDSFRLKRLPINQDDDLRLLTAKLSGAYDWLGTFQSLSKRLRGTQGRKRPTEEQSNCRNDGSRQCTPEPACYQRDMRGPSGR